MRLTIRHKPALHLTAIFILGLLLYSNTFGVPFQFDDVSNIADNQLIKHIENVPSFFSGGSGPFASRPLLHATVAINYYIGRLDTLGYHAVNLALHLINAVLLYLLMIIVGRQLGREERSVRLAAWLAAIIFTVHPIQTEAVTYIVSRSVLLATAFFLSGMILFYRSVTSENKKTVYISALFVVSLLGMASRENFVTFPLMLVIYDLLFISRLNVRAAARHYSIYVPVFASIAYYMFLVINNTYARSPGLPGWGIDPLEYALTQLNIHVTYLRLLALPLNQSITYDYPIVKTLLEPNIALSLFGYLMLWVISGLLARRRPEVSFGLLWFLITLVPISFAVAFMGLRLGDPIFEHRAYLPSVGVIAVASWWFVSFMRARENLRARAIVAVVVLVVALSVLTYKRNAVWQSAISLWSDAVAKAPNNPIANGNLGSSYADVGRLDLANKYFKLQMQFHRGSRQYGQIITGGEGMPDGHPRGGGREEISDALDTEMGIRQYEAALKSDPGDAGAHSILGALYKRKGMYEKAIEHYEAAIALIPDDAELHNNLANVYDSVGRTGEAIAHYEEAIGLRPGYAIAHYNLGIAYLNMGEREKARDELKKALELKPDLTQASQLLKQL